MFVLGFYLEKEIMIRRISSEWASKDKYWAQMNNTGFFSPIPIPIQYSCLNQQFQYNPDTNTISFSSAIKLIFYTNIC